MISARFAHTCIRVNDVHKSLAFYELLGYELRGRLSFEPAYSLFLGQEGDGPTLQLTVNVDNDQPYDLGTGYNHMALAVDNLDAALVELAAAGIEPEQAPFSPGDRPGLRICFIFDPDGYRVELIDTPITTPSDPPHPAFLASAS
jgi:lactoylglutathione lyase